MTLSWQYDEGMAFVRLRVPEAFIALMQAIIESYEGLALVRTHDVEGSVMVVVTSVEQRNSVAGLLEDLGGVMPWECEEGSGEPLESLLAGAEGGEK